MYTVGVITSSDAGARGEREDTSGALIKRLLAAPEFEHRAYVVVPDDRALIEQTLTSWADDDHLDLIVRWVRCFELFHNVGFVPLADILRRRSLDREISLTQNVHTDGDDYRERRGQRSPPEHGRRE